MAKSPNRILLAESFPDAACEKLRLVGEVQALDRPDPRALEEAIGDCHALLVRTYTRVTRSLLDRAPHLRVIGRAGVGLENVDLDAAREKGIQVGYTPEAATDAVADLTVGLMITLVRKLPQADRMVREGRFVEARSWAVGSELNQLTLGIIGMGRIGQAVARRCSLGFGMNVFYNDIRPIGPLDFPATPAEKDILYRQSDVLSLHVPLTRATRQLINAETLGQLKRDAILINTARGDVVDSDALAIALVSGRLGGAGLDVFDQEPLPIDHPLISAPNTMLVPHIGARTFGGLVRMDAVVDDVIRVLQGRTPRFPAWV